MTDFLLCRIPNEREKIKMISTSWSKQYTYASCLPLSFFSLSFLAAFFISIVSTGILSHTVSTFDCNPRCDPSFHPSFLFWLIFLLILFLFFSLSHNNFRSIWKVLAIGIFSSTPIPLHIHDTAERNDSLCVFVHL